jgi:gliding motility-associated-like protein
VIMWDNFLFKFSWRILFLLFGAEQTEVTRGNSSYRAPGFLFMPFTLQPLRNIIATAVFLFIGYSHSHAQVVCEKGYYAEYIAGGHLLPASITSLHNGQQVITGKASVTSADRMQGMVVRVSETGSVLWSIAMDAGEGAVLKGMLEKANGQYIVYGNLYSAADPDGKIWLVCLDQAGNLQWSRVIESGHPGSELLYSLIELPDGDLAGTFNIADSTGSSRPVVFRMRDDGTLRWTREYAQNQAVAFNSLSFANGKIYAAGFQQVVKKKALIMLLDEGTGDIVERRYPAYWNQNYEQEAAFIQVFNNRISYIIRFRDPSLPTALFSTAFVQSSLDNTTDFGTQKSGVETDGEQVQIKRTRYNDWMIMRSYNYQSQLINHSQFGQINWSRRLTPYYNNGQIHTGFDTANGGGGISVGHYSNFTTNGLSRMKVVRMTSKGNGGSCTDNGFTFHSDTIHLIHQNLNWSGVPSDATLSVQSASAISITPLVLQNSEECATSECTDLAALDPGCNKTMMVEYATPFRSQLSDAVSLGDGGRIAVGRNGYFPWVVKLKENGDVDWSRFYNQHNYTGELKRAVRLTANTILIAGHIYTTVDHGASTYNYLLKIDNNGNILSSQILNSYGESEVADLVPTDDGGFLLVEAGIYGFPPIYNFVTRFDANMQIVWKKTIDVYGVSAISRSVYISNGKIYLGHDYYLDPWSKRVGVIRLDFGTGNFDWTRTFEVTNGGFPLRFNRVIAVADTVYGFVTEWRNDGTRLLMVRINQQGQIIDAKSVGNFNLIAPPNSYVQQDISRPTVTLTPHMDFVTANLVKTAAGQALNISRFNRNGEAIWSRNYTSYDNHSVFNIRPHASGYQMVGRVLRSAGQFDVYFNNSFFLKTDSVGKLTLSPTGDCAPVDATSAFTSSLVNVNVVTDNRVQGVVENNWLEIKPLNVFAIPAFTDATLTCHRQSDCNPVTIGVSGDICQLNQPVQCYLQNNNCGAVAKWSFDPDYFDELNRKADTLTLLPKRTGSSVIMAGVEDDCTFREISTTISIAVLASSLELGNDTVLCANNTLLLKAGQGFQSYVWNDGSSDAGLLVTQPGKYYVRVTDHCGNEASDTVLVEDPQNWFTISGPLQKCNTDTIRLTVPDTFSQVIWSPNNSLQADGHSAKAFPLQTSQVSVQAEWMPGCIVKDTVDITVLHSPGINLGNAINICYNDTITLTAPAGFSNYSWNTGENSNEIRVSKEGTYQVSALYFNGCFSYDTVLVQKRAFIFPDIGADKSICSNEPNWLTPGNYAQYLWSTGANTQKLLVSAPGIYWVAVTDNYGCEGIDTMQVTGILEGPFNYLPEQLQLCPGEELSIVPVGMYSKYQWSTGSVNSFIRVKDTSTYSLKVVDANGCAGIDSVSVQYKADCPQSIYFPNAFTPNGDRINDRFAPVIYGIVISYQFEIYNRWGQLIFRSNDPNQGWDGRYNGILQPNDVFAWKCHYQFPGVAVQKHSGLVTLVR